MNQPCLILMPHGSKNPQWSEPFRELTEKLRRQLGPGSVYLAFMELTTPTLMDAAREIMQTPAREARILPLFMARGNHFKEDIPVQIAATSAAFPELKFHLLDPIGRYPQFFDLMGEMIGHLYRAR